MMTDPRRSWQRFRSLTRYSLVSVGATGGRKHASNVRMVRAVLGAAASEARHSPAEDPVRGGDDPPVVRPPRAKPHGSLPGGRPRGRPLLGAAAPTDSSGMHARRDPRLARVPETGSELALWLER